MSVPKIQLLIFWFLITKSVDFYGQITTDSLVLFSELKYHSEFEKNQFSEFQEHAIDTFRIFLAIDENMTQQIAEKYYQNFETIFDLIKQKKLDKNLNKKGIEKIFKLVHEKFLRNYRNLSHFPAIFSTGTYNCVSASILYALIFSHLNIPYKIFQTPVHVYLVAFPGAESLVIETTNPAFSPDYFNQHYKEDYVQKLKSIKMIYQNERLEKSIDEIFHEQYYKGTEADFPNLLGFEYMNKAINDLKNNNYDSTYELLQKAYFFFPERQLSNLLYNELIKKISNSKFNEIEDINYLNQLLRYKFVDQHKVMDIFTAIIQTHLNFTDKVGFCDSLLSQFVGQITDPEFVLEIKFSYYLQLSEQFENSEKMVPYIEKAISIKQNHTEANRLFLEQICRRLDCVNGFDALNDSINSLQKKYNYQFAEQLFTDYRLIAFLNQSYNFFSYNKIKEGEYYLKKFEETCDYPVSFERKKLIRSIELAYRSLVICYINKKDNQTAQQTIERGLKFVPGNQFIQAVSY